MRPARLATPAAIFRAGLHARVHIAVKATAAYEPGLGLVVRVDELPTAAFDAAGLLAADGPAQFSDLGDATWNTLHAFARSCIADLGQPDDLAAVILSPNAAALARQRLQLQRAA